jgi:hypothetical protein
MRSTHQLQEHDPLACFEVQRVTQLQQKWSRHQSPVKASLLREAFLRLNVDLIALKPSVNCEGTRVCSAIMFHGTLGCQCSRSLA